MTHATLTDDLIKAFESVTVIALDIEGVDLGRTGQISLVQIASSPEACFLLDLLNVAKDDPLVDWLKAMLESKDIVKICHDCRMDADALRHILGIELCNVHDTSAWHCATDANLNNVLIANSIKPNVKRDSGVYAQNHAFWATRPLTSRMMEWAMGDVRSMFELHAKQLVGASPERAAEAKLLSDRHIDAARGCQVAHVHVKYPGRFIGPSGSSIRAMQRSSNTLVYPRGKRGDNSFIVYFSTADGLAAVRARAIA